MNGYYNRYDVDERDLREVAILYSNFGRTATLYEDRIEYLITSRRYFDDVKNTAMEYVADLIDLSNQLIDLIIRGSS